MIILHKVGTVGGGGASPSAWVNKVSVSEDSGTHIITANHATGGWGTQGAGTADSISSAGGWVKTTIGELNKYRGFGIDPSNSHTHYNTVDYLAFFALASLEIFQSGGSQGVGPTLVAEDEILIHLSPDGVVEFWINSVLKRLGSTKAVNFPYYGVAVFDSIGGTMRPLTFGPLLAGSPPANGVTWRNKTQCGVGTSNALQSFLNGWTSAGATSNESAASGESKTLEFTLTGFGGVVCGFTTSTSNLGYASLARSILVYGNGGAAQVREGGSEITAWATAPGHVMKITLDAGGVARYYGNDAIKRTNTTALASFPYYVGAGFEFAASRLEGVRLY